MRHEVVLQGWPERGHYPSGVMDKRSLGYRDLLRLHPRLVYASVSGFGHYDALQSPFSSSPAYGPIAESMGGLTDALITVSGAYTLDIVLAQRDRQHTGNGQYAAVAMSEPYWHYAIWRSCVARFSQSAP